MTARFTWRRLALGLGVLSAGLAAWLLVAPAQLGGQLSYVVVHGGSMEPGLSDGDLAVVRHAERYETGDAVAYRSRQLDRVVLHRIVESEGERFVLKGDANSWTDSSRPPQSDVLGALWFSVPVVGSGVEWLAEPLHAAVLSGVLALLCLGGAGATVRSRRRRRSPSEQPVIAAPEPRAPQPEPRAGSVLLAQALPIGLVLSAFGLLAFITLGLVAFSRPGVREAPVEVAYTQTGSFDYTGASAAGPVYQDGAADTGEPVFLRLVDALDVGFAYRLRTDAEGAVGGTARLAADLSDESGWRRELPLAPTRAFTGQSVLLTGRLDLKALRALIGRIEASTGVPRQSYTVELAPEVELTGRLGEAPVDESFAPRLRFRFDSAHMQLEDVASSGSRTPAVHPEKQGSLELTERAANTLGLGSLRVEVSTARRIAMFGGAIALAILVLVSLGRRASLRAGEPTRIRATYGHLLVPLAAEPEAAAPVIDVASISGLVRMAEAAGRPILDYNDAGEHTYYVDDGTALYRYCGEGAEQPSDEPIRPEPASEQEIPGDRLAVVLRATQPR